MHAMAAVDVMAGDVDVLEVPNVVVDVPALLAVGHDAAEVDDQVIRLRDSVSGPG